MLRYLLIMMIFCLSAPSVFARNLDEQFQLWSEDKQSELQCFDELSDFLYCLNKNKAGKFVLLDQEGQEIYQVYWFDNGPDYIQEGLYRIRQNSKIGYASGITGKVIIEAHYDCAYPFSDGRANVGIGCESKSDGEHSFWIGGEWQWIDNPLLENKHLGKEL